VQKSAGKFLASVFWDKDGILLIDFFQRAKLSSGILVISASAIEGYLEGKTPREIHQFFLFLHANGPVHRALAAQKKMAYLGFQCIDHSSYSPDLVPSDCHL